MEKNFFAFLDELRHFQQLLKKYGKSKKFYPPAPKVWKIPYFFFFSILTGSLRKLNMPKIINFLLVFGGFWALGGVLRGLRELLEPSCDPLGASWRHDGAHLERSCTVLSHLGGHLGASEALFEPSRAILHAPTRRGPPRPGPGEGVGGGVK